jgi:hypothetical protein
MKDIPRGAYLDCFARQSEGHREHEDVAFWSFADVTGSALPSPLCP